jgi:hypothetical protein
MFRHRVGYESGTLGNPVPIDVGAGWVAGGDLLATGGRERLVARVDGR